MNKKSVFKLTMALMVMAVAVVFTSCNKQEDLYDPGFEHNSVVKKYEAAFVKYFGEVAPDQNWDFSQRGSHVAGTRAKSNSYIEDWRGDQSYGYVWNYPEKSGKSDPMTPDLVNTLCHNYMNVITAAIENTSTSTWTPSNYNKMVFRTLFTTRNTATSTKYFAMGASVGQEHLFLRMASPDNANNGNGGTTSDQHTSSLDFSMVPSTAVWYVCSTTGQNKNHIDYDPSNITTLTTFKDVTVTIGDNQYRLWCFMCDPNGDYTDLVLLVAEASDVPVLRTLKRYMVEDVGQSDDFDFNDVVFDVAEFSDGHQVCYVRALGGTLAITINVGSKSWSKSPTYTVTDMLNTDDPNTSLCLAEFEVSGWIPANNNVSVDVIDKDGYHYGVPFPDDGDIPFIVATRDGKKWRTERSRIPGTDWFWELD